MENVDLSFRHRLNMVIYTMITFSDGVNTCTNRCRENFVYYNSNGIVIDEWIVDLAEGKEAEVMQL